jgi:hypothetical protein
MPRRHMGEWMYRSTFSWREWPASRSVCFMTGRKSPWYLLDRKLGRSQNQNLPVYKGRLSHKANFTILNQLATKCGNLNISHPCGPPQSFTGMTYSLHINNVMYHSIPRKRTWKSWYPEHFLLYYSIYWNIMWPHNVMCWDNLLLKWTVLRITQLCPNIQHKHNFTVVSLHFRS